MEQVVQLNIAQVKSLYLKNLYQKLNQSILKKTIDRVIFLWYKKNKNLSQILFKG